MKAGSTEENGEEENGEEEIYFSVYCIFSEEAIIKNF